ncbi:MAG: HAMP domain-containing protein, partial [Planctomycetes bacterium]|nr:HAMP domain-containing protein [Planctomycetota bacterium]
MGIRTKLTIFISLLLVVLDALTCLFFYMHEKKEHEGLLVDTGNTLIMMLSRDNEVSYAIKQAQPAFLDLPLKRLRIADSGRQIGYWRISNKQTTITEGAIPWINTRISEIPPGEPNLQDTPLIRVLTSNAGEKFLDFSLSVSENSAFSEEVFAEQVLDNVTLPTKSGVLGFVQIGLTTKRLKEYLFRSVFYTIVPLGAVVALVGIALSLFLTRYLTLPIRYLAAVTQDIAKGNLSKSVHIQAKDEIGQLSVNFNTMVRSLEKLYGDLKQEITKHEHTEELLQYRLEMEGLVVAISSKFLNLTPDKFDDEINYV